MIQTNNKLDKRLDHLFKYENDKYFDNFLPNDNISEKLLEYQFLHVFNIMSAFQSNNVVLDGSDPGTGKTYTSLAICSQLNLKPFIICPKTIMSTWAYVCKLFKIDPIAIVNYETIKAGKYYNQNNERTECKYIEIIKLDENNIQFKWLGLPKNSVIIFDEVHKCKNKNSINGQLLLSTKNLNKVLMLSGTLADKPDQFHIFGYMLGLYKQMRQAGPWIKGMLREDKSEMDNKLKLSAINKRLYPDKGSRMRISELGSKFPGNQVSADCYYIKDKDRKEVNKYFEIFKKGDTVLKGIKKEDTNGAENDPILVEIGKARQKIELIKVDIIKGLVEDYIDNGYNVVIFVNYTKTIEKLSAILKTNSIVSGEEDIKTRTENIRKFQNNETNIIICNIAICEGMDLHDLNGKPRVSLISPSFDSSQLVQALARIHRAGSKSPALQRIIFCAGTCEEIICNRIKEKLQFMAKLNDNDLVKID